MNTDLRIYDVAERPELVRIIDDGQRDAWPEFLLHDRVGLELWSRIYNEFAEFAFGVFQPGDVLVGVGLAVPLYWDGTLQGLPNLGWAGVLLRAFQNLDAGTTPNTLAAVAAVVMPSYRGQGLGGLILQTMRKKGLENEINTLIAPVRPTLKESYPLIPMVDYSTWELPDGLPFDPWLRIHARLGARRLAIGHDAMVVEGTVAQWHQWTGLHFPQSGQYVVPGALVPVSINVEQDRGRYIEPCVWMLHAGQ